MKPAREKADSDGTLVNGITRYCWAIFFRFGRVAPISPAQNDIPGMFPLTVLYCVVECNRENTICNIEFLHYLYKLLGYALPGVLSGKNTEIQHSRTHFALGQVMTGGAYI